MVEKSGTIAHGFAIDETVQQLCISGTTVSANVDGRPKRIYRKDMTTLAQMEETAESQGQTSQQQQPQQQEQEQHHLTME
ncbi:hypothetical protein Lal_00038155 [Lupinus albus]|nr:hypothetical protein Lal_00038155 [Lupinus albus]